MSHAAFQPSRRSGIVEHLQAPLKPNRVPQSQERCFACVISGLSCPTLGLNLPSSPGGPGVVSEDPSSLGKKASENCKGGGSSGCSGSSLSWLSLPYTPPPRGRVHLEQKEGRGRGEAAGVSWCPVPC